MKLKINLLGFCLLTGCLFTGLFFNLAIGASVNPCVLDSAQWTYQVTKFNSDGKPQIVGTVLQKLVPNPNPNPNLNKNITSDNNQFPYALTSSMGVKFFMMSDTIQENSTGYISNQNGVVSEAYGAGDSKGYKKVSVSIDPPYQGKIRVLVNNNGKKKILSLPALSPLGDNLNIILSLRWALIQSALNHQDSPKRFMHMVISNNAQGELMPMPYVFLKQENENNNHHNGATSSLKTALGVLKTVEYTRYDNVADEQDYYWFAVDKNYLPVKITSEKKNSVVSSLDINTYTPANGCVVMVKK